MPATPTSSTTIVEHRGCSLLEACMDYEGMSWRCENNCYSHNDEMWTGWTKVTEHQRKPENATALYFGISWLYLLLWIKASNSSSLAKIPPECVVVVLFCLFACLFSY